MSVVDIRQIILNKLDKELAETNCPIEFAELRNRFVRIRTRVGFVKNRNPRPRSTS